MTIFFRRLLSLWAICIGAGTIIRWSIDPPFSELNSIWTIGNILIITFGIVFLSFGLYLLFPLYRFPKGILVNPPWVAKFYDFISMLFGGAAAIMVVDLILIKAFDISSNLYEEELTFMSVFFLIIGILILAAYTSRLAHQAIEVDEEAIRINGPSGTHKIRWKDIEKIELSDEYVMVGRGGAMIPRQLQKRLKVITKMGESYYINEPQLKGKKEVVINLIRNNIPPSLRNTYIQVLDEW